MILFFEARGWWGPLHGGSHVKRMVHEDGKGGGSGDYSHDLLPFARVSEFLSKHVYGKEKGSLILNPIFIIGKLTSESVKEIGYFIDGFSDKHATVRISGRSLKHADEQRHKSFIKIVDALPDIIKNSEVIANPNRDNSVFLVHQTDENYLLVLEIAKNGNGSDVVNIITTRNRGLKRHREKSAEWLEGRRSLILDTKRNHAGGDISDVQPSGFFNIPKPLEKSSVIGKFKAKKDQTKMIKSILFIKSGGIQKVVDAKKKVILFFKSNVKGHTRRLKSGGLVYVSPYSNRVTARAHEKDERQLSLFENNERQPDLFDDVSVTPKKNVTDQSYSSTDLAEDREDLADEMMRDPHSDKSRELLRKVAEKQEQEQIDILRAKIDRAKRCLREAKGSPEKITKIEREIRELRRQIMTIDEPVANDQPMERKATDDSPKEGERNAEGLVFRDGRWHREDDELTPLDKLRAKVAELGGKEKIAQMFKQNKAQGDALINQLVKILGLSREEVLTEFDLQLKSTPKPKADTVPVEKTPLADEDNPNSPNYRYRDTGYVAGSRKELAASVIRLAAKNGRRVNAQEIDWEEIEINPREAKELITKSNLFGDVSWDNLREQGMQPGAGFLIDRVYASVGTSPAEDNPQVRKDYVFGLQTLRERLERCANANDVIKTIDEMRDESRGVMLADGDAEKYQSVDREIKELYGRIHELDEKNDIAYAALRNADSAKHRIENEIGKRQRRKWKVPPEMQAELNEATKHADDARKIYEIVFNENKPVVERLRESARAMATEMRKITEQLVARNAAENPLTRAWSVMGERFNAVLNFRSSVFAYRGKRVSGSEAFRSHVVSAKNDRIKDWAWAEKEGGIKVKQEKKESVRFQLKVADTFNRVGGREIKPESTVDLKDRFNLREVQSGNWVLRDPVSAKFHVEHTAGAFADLADIIGVPDRDVSLNGRLAMAFGARGAGAKGWKDSAAMAHYEPVHRIINLTKMGGGGALGHEWAHALDNMIKEAMTGEAGKKDDFVTEDPTLLPPGELRDAFIGVRSAMLSGNEKASEKLTYSDSDIRLADHNINRMMVSGIAKLIKESSSAEKAVEAIDDLYDKRVLSKKALKSKNDWRRIAVAYHDRKPGGASVWVKSGPGMSRFAIEARILDAGGTRYWESTHEMFARAFQSYIEDTLSSMGRKNDYLSSYADNKYHVDPLLGIQWKPYPEGEERERINIAMERLLAAVRKHDVLAKAAAMFDRGERLMAG